LEILGNITSWNSSYNAEHWFLFPYACLSLTAVYIFRLIDRLEKWKYLTLFALLHFVAGYIISRYIAVEKSYDSVFAHFITYIELTFDFVLGVQMAASARDLVFMSESIPEGSTWTVAGVGRHQFQMAALAIVMGGHVRVGFEDNVYIDKGVLAKSNGELVERVVRLAKELGREIATPDEARQILSLKK